MTGKVRIFGKGPRVNGTRQRRTFPVAVIKRPASAFVKNFISSKENLHFVHKTLARNREGKNTANASITNPIKVSSRKLFNIVFNKLMKSVFKLPKTIKV